MTAAEPEVLKLMEQPVTIITAADDQAKTAQLQDLYNAAIAVIKSPDTHPAVGAQLGLLHYTPSLKLNTRYRSPGPLADAARIPVRNNPPGLANAIVTNPLDPDRPCYLTDA